MTDEDVAEVKPIAVVSGADSVVKLLEAASAEVKVAVLVRLEVVYIEKKT